VVATAGLLLILTLARTGRADQAAWPIGLDISTECPRPLTAGKVQAADIRITMNCGDACPAYQG
jgi:arsenate reductase